jgi:hypothetical protein
MRLLSAKYYPFQVWLSTLLPGSYLGVWLNFVQEPDTLSFETALLFPFLIFYYGIIWYPARIGGLLLFIPVITKSPAAG